MSELVEIVARAIYGHAASRPEGQPDWDGADDDVREWVADHALAALRAIEGAGYKVVGRDMTWPMRKAVLDATSFTQAPTTDTIWQAAFDAAPTVGGAE